MRPARARVVGRFHHAARITEGTVTLDRGAGLFTVRPLRSRKVYTLPLDRVAEMVVQRVIKADLFLKHMEKAKRKGKR